MYLSADGPDGSASPYNNGGYGSDEPGKSYLVTADVCSGSALWESNSSISGSSIGGGRIPTQHTVPTTTAGITGMSRTQSLPVQPCIGRLEEDVFTSAGAGGCFHI